MVDTIRLAKYIATSGIYSRKEAEQLIINNEVKVNGKVFKQFTIPLKNNFIIEVKNQQIKPLQTIKIYKFYKTVRTITTTSDPQKRHTIFDIIRSQYKLEHNLKSIGRLDYNTEGLLLLTNNGELARAFELPINKYCRIYEVGIWGFFSLDILKSHLQNGVQIGNVFYQPIKLQIIHSHNHHHVIQLLLNEGKNREIRNILSFYNFKVKFLKRIQFGPIKLSNLQKGEMRELSQVEYNLIKKDLSDCFV